MKVSSGRGWCAMSHRCPEGASAERQGRRGAGGGALLPRPWDGIDCRECPIILLRNAEGFRLFGRREITSRRRVGSVSGGKVNTRQFFLFG